MECNHAVIYGLFFVVQLLAYGLWYMVMVKDIWLQDVHHVGLVSKNWRYGQITWKTDKCQSKCLRVCPFVQSVLSFLKLSYLCSYNAWIYILQMLGVDYHIH